MHQLSASPQQLITFCLRQHLKCFSVLPLKRDWIYHTRQIRGLRFLRSVRKMEFVFEPFSFLSCLSPFLILRSLDHTHYCQRLGPRRLSPPHFWSPLGQKRASQTWSLLFLKPRDLNTSSTLRRAFYLPLPSVQVNQAKWEYFTTKKEFSPLEMESGKQTLRNKQATVRCLQSDSLRFHGTDAHSGRVWPGLPHLGPRRKECPLTE